MDEVLIVDGYNIIGAWPELNALKDTNLEEARDRLIDTLAEYQSFSGIKVLLVFDAYQVPGLGRKYEMSKLAVYYTKEKETADELIERLVFELMGRRKRISVATSDMIEQHVIFAKGALRLSSRELLQKVRQSQKELKTRIRSQSTRSRNNLDAKLSDEMKSILERWRRGDQDS